MSYLDNLKSKYGNKNTSSEEKYAKAVKFLKEKIEEAFAKGKKCCRYYDYPEVMDRLEQDPEFEGFKIKPADVAPQNPEHIAKLFCWD